MIPDALLWALWDAPVANVEEWAVLVCMAGRADPDGCSTYQSNDTIAEATKLSPDTVKRRQRSMRERGLIAYGNQAAATEYRAGHRPVVYDLQVPYDWFGTSIGRVNKDRAKRGRQPLTPDDRPPLGDAPAKRARKDFGVPRPKPGAKPAGDVKPDIPDVGGLEAPPMREGYKHPHPDDDDAPGGARGGARGGASSTPTKKEDLLSFGEKTKPLGDAADADAASADADVLFGDFGKATPRSRKPEEKTPDPAVVTAQAICGEWWDALRIKPSGARAFANVLALVADDVRVGRPADQIGRALRECGVAVTRAALNLRYEQQDRPGHPRSAAAGGGIVQRNSHFRTPGATFGMPGQPDEETPR